jgi:hypothetical protein
MIINPPEVCRKLRDDPSEDYYFLTVDKKPVKETKIEKNRFVGKLYDVDVPEGIILVCRDGGVPV